MKKELSSKQTEELFKILKVRFEKNMNRHKGIEWATLKTKLEANANKFWSLNEMEETGGEPDVVGFDKRRENIFFMIVQPKALMAAEAFATTMKRWKKGKKINLKTALLIWQMLWLLSC